MFIVALIAYAAANGIAENKLWPFRHLAAAPVFLWGEELASFQERESLRKNLFWVVIVGFFVSLVAGIATLLV